MLKGKRRRVVVTGMGAVSPLGNDVETTWRAILDCRSGVELITKFDTTRFDTKFAAEIKNFTAEDYIPAREVRRMDRFIHYAIASSKQAAAHADFVVSPENADDTGVLIGSGIGGIESFTDAVVALKDKGPSRVSPFAITMILTDLAAGQVSIQMGLRGPNFAIVSACATAAHSIGEAAEMIRRGQAKAVFAGGAEATVCELGLASFGSMRALSTRNDDYKHASRPFDKERDGFVLGEGAAVLLLEDLEFAQERGANILAEVVGYGATADASHVTAPAEGGEGAARAINLALKDAGLRPEDIGYINAHGTSTPHNEKFETMAIKRALGDHAYRVPISSTKSMTGHMLGAAGSMEAIFCIKAMQEGILPPTINYEVPDPDCDLDYIPNEPRRADVRYTMSNSMGFGGHNAVLILGKYEG